MYAQWKARLHPSMRLHLVELAGRGRRFQDCLYGTMSEVVEDIYGRIEPQLEAGDFAFFGHSMGALICYELIGKIWSRRNLAPIHAFLSGRVPPNNHETKMLHLQSDADLMAEVTRWGGFSAQQLADNTFIRMLLPILRADLKVVETYHLPERKYHRLPCPLSILTGANDAIAEAWKMQRWADFTTQSCSFHVFPGDHFYIIECKEKVVHLINSVVFPATPL